MIENKIAELQRAKRTLLEAFGEKDTAMGDKLRPSPSIRRRKAKKGTRKRAVLKLLRENGPLTRGEILQKTGFPIGTIAFVLNDKNQFHSKEGKWYPAESDNQEKKEERVLPETSKTLSNGGDVPERFKGSDL